MSNISNPVRDRPVRHLDSVYIGGTPTNVPSLEALGVTMEMMEVAEEIVSGSDVLGVERTTLETLIRVVIWMDRECSRDGAI